jgi:DNA-directed RNA polymerase specialized sigma24 family protein
MLPHLDAAYNFARWLMRNTEDAEDAVQDAFLRPTSHSPATKAAVRKPG